MIYAVSNSGQSYLFMASFPGSRRSIVTAQPLLAAFALAQASRFRTGVRRGIGRFWIRSFMREQGIPWRSKMRGGSPGTAAQPPANPCAADAGFVGEKAPGQADRKREQELDGAGKRDQEEARLNEPNDREVSQVHPVGGIGEVLDRPAAISRRTAQMPSDP